MGNFQPTSAQLCTWSMLGGSRGGAPRSWRERDATSDRVETCLVLTQHTAPRPGAVATGSVGPAACGGGVGSANYAILPGIMIGAVEPLLYIGATAYAKTGRGVFEVPLERLGVLRFNDFPHYSTVDIIGLHGDTDSYELAITATHSGGPADEHFFIMVHVKFTVSGDPNDPSTRRTCEKKADRVRCVFRPLVADGTLDDADGGNDHRTYFKQSWLVNVLYSADFTRDENPELAAFVRPVVERFQELLRTPDHLLFLCHASEDKDFVDWLAERLDAEDVDIWYDRREIRAGDSIVERINDGLASASHVVVVLSQAAIRKPWVSRELSSALMMQVQDSSVRVIPVLRERCDMPTLLSDIRYADCGSDRESGFMALIEAIGV